MDFLTLEGHWENTIGKLNIKQHCEINERDRIIFKTLFFLGAQSAMNLTTNLLTEREKGVKYTNIYDTISKMIEKFDKESQEFFNEHLEEQENGTDTN